MRSVVILALAVILSACSTSTYLVTGEKRAPIDPSQVKVYTSYPPGAEEVAQITAKSERGWTDQGKQEAAIEEMKERAASLGANGIVVTGTQGTGSSTGFTTGGQMMFFGSNKVHTSGIAIYVSGDD